MAGDWIKMRWALAKHPKVLAIAERLCDDPDFMRWLEQPGGHECRATALELVTFDCVTRVTVASLLALWGAANDMGELVGSDVVLRYATRYVADEMAQLPGLSAAMEAVGWLIIDEDNDTVTLPRFLTYNTPADERKRIGNATRQAKYRAKKASERRVTKGVTSRVTDPPKSNAREEKSRGDITNRKPISNRAFVPPTVDEVRAYCIEHKSTIDPQAFIDHYKSNGWRVGRNPMKDWRAAVRKWQTNQGNFSRGQKSFIPGDGQNFTGGQIDAI